ncbi:MAG: ribosome small subunit-dependent GTPase A [Hamadaea sp.]|uniref:ribosome small subunit-dependent GTPase A n=1 Tax=Hamadaea sp. NPDC050747 TaxID=3155789 RepID=UPI00184A307C|nr:ribosome small subunit-dependent GTPase A [Hamadaea sp.]NUR49550.1 ribosome small subunit-dependent GTPase A [Hamadaea sp.]NUR72473.1 ribosome small subunit-dependent GTPase A [Hamadaea sp.]NUT08758.1 ribosome small subunit-dependent GTPase A [Hamadaea sp.]
MRALGWDDHFAAAYAPFDRIDARPGRVLRVDRGVCTVLTAQGADRASLGGGVMSQAAADAVHLPCTGDWVVVRDWPDRRTTIEAVLPRRTQIMRRTADKDSTAQVLAANMDTAAVIEPLDSGPDLSRIERLLALAWDSGAEPLVVLTKADVTRYPDAIVEQVREIAPGAPVLAVSADTGAGLDELRPHVAEGRTTALLGRSGAGKSTLVNALAGTTVMTTQAVRRVDGKGRHTTTHRALVPIPGGGAVIDTPGLRGVGLLDGSEGLVAAFADVDALALRCKFADCSHTTEPGCAVQAALDDGELTGRRWASWLRLQRELAHESKRKAVRLREEQRAARQRARERHA